MRSGLLFQDRIDAGRQLGIKLLPYKSAHSLVLALPRGGVPVGYEVALALDAPLDTIVARKIGAPYQREFGVGAIAPGGVTVLDNRSIQVLGVLETDIDRIIAEETQELERRMALYRSGEYSKITPADTIFIIDDGLATGVTARAAIESARHTRQPKKMVFAAPVCAHDTADTLRALVNNVVCIHEVDNLLAIGLWYHDFSQTTDEEVLDYLEKAAERVTK